MVHIHTFRLSLSHHQVCVFMKMCHTAFVMATFIVAHLKIYIDVKIPNVSLKVHVLSHASLVTCIKTVFNCYATIKHMLLLVCVDVFVRNIYVTYTMSMTLDPFCVLDMLFVKSFMIQTGFMVYPVCP
jgi:hypothetical protein